MEGETGTGKTLLAQVIHERSPRRQGPFVTQGCGSFTESLAEATLYGHEKGAFTGAHVAKPGIFEAAHNGTLVLNDLDALPLGIQGRLLEIFDTRQVMRLGSTKPIRIDVQVIVTTNQDPERLVDDGRLRRDLFFRIAALRHKLPPLRRRRRDLPTLVRMTIETLWERDFVTGSGPSPAPTPEAIQLLAQQAWPGNFRDLTWVLARCLATAPDGVIDEELVRTHLVEDPPPSEGEAGGGSGSGRGKKQRYKRIGTPEDEKRRMLEALEATGYNVSQAASRCGMSRSAFWMKMRFHRIETDPDDSSSD